MVDDSGELICCCSWCGLIVLWTVLEESRLQEERVRGSGVLLVMVGGLRVAGQGGEV